MAAVLLGVALLLVAAGAAFLGWKSHSTGGVNSAWLAPVAFVVSGFFLVCSVGVPLGLLRESNLKDEEEWRCKNDCDQLDKALEGIGDKTLRGLAQVNFKQMRTFTIIAQQQARMSYYASLAASVTSLFVLLVGTAAANGLTATPAKITAGTLAAAGAVLSGFLAKTFISSYAMASRQMSYYYGQPLVHCYLLHAEWLASQAAGSAANHAQFQLWQEIIKASLRAGVSAQNHLLDLPAADQNGRAGASAPESVPAATNGTANGLASASGAKP